MGERLLCKQEVDGSIPFTSTIGWADSLSAGSKRSREVAIADWSPKEAGGMIFDR